MVVFYDYFCSYSFVDFVLYQMLTASLYMISYLQWLCLYCLITIFSWILLFITIFTDSACQSDKDHVLAWGFMIQNSSQTNLYYKFLIYIFT